MARPGALQASGRNGDLVRYPGKYGADDAPKGMIVDKFLSGGYAVAWDPDSTVTTGTDGRLEGLGPFRSLSVGFDCVEENNWNHLYLYQDVCMEGNRFENTYIWELSGDTLTIYGYDREDVISIGKPTGIFKNLVRL